MQRLSMTALKRSRFVTWKVYISANPYLCLKKDDLYDFQDAKSRRQFKQ